MKLSEAIEIIQADIDDENVDWDTPLGIAYKISFEALKRLEHCRSKGEIYSVKLLPGETLE